jgi:hypothetical protein
MKAPISEKIDTAAAILSYLVETIHRSSYRGDLLRLVISVLLYQPTGIVLLPI